MDTDTQEITIQWFLSAVVEKSCYQAAYQIL